ncbi:hypothetical protein AB4853_40980 [Bradyrhizobium sp. 1050_B9_N1_2]
MSEYSLEKGALDPISLRLAILLGSQLRDRFGGVPVGRHSPYSVLCYIEDMYRVVDRPITSSYRNDAMRIDTGGVSICQVDSVAPASLFAQAVAGGDGVRFNPG